MEGGVLGQDAVTSPAEINRLVVIERVEFQWKSCHTLQLDFNHCACFINPCVLCLNLKLPLNKKKELDSIYISMYCTVFRSLASWTQVLPSLTGCMI
jgi:hypothetical protein